MVTPVTMTIVFFAVIREVVSSSGEAKSETRKIED